MPLAMQMRKVSDIEYQLLPSVSRKTTDIVIERDGTICVRPPASLTPEQIDATVYSKRLWIYRHLAEWRDLNAARITREWVNGESFLYLGRHYRLSLVNQQNEALKLKDGRFCLLRSLVERHGAAGAQQAFEQFYTQKGTVRIRQQAARLAPKVGVTLGNICVKDLGYRWAACLTNGDLHFHWKCLMAPPNILDYIIVHELCHQHYRDHSEAFWNEVDKVLPDYRERKVWLRENGATLSL